MLDLVIDVVFRAQPLAGVALFVAAFVTGLYSARATRLTFFGERRTGASVHESPATMLVPLLVLGIPALAAGFGGNAIFSALAEKPEALSIPLSAIAVLLALAGAAAGWFLVGGERGDEVLESRAGFAWRASATAFGYDALVYRLAVGPAIAGARILWAVIDRYVIDGSVEVVARLARRFGGLTSDIQTGDTQWYGVMIVAGVALMLAVSAWLGRS